MYIIVYYRGTLVGLLAGSVLGLWISIGAIVNKDNLDDALGLYKVRRIGLCWLNTKYGSRHEIQKLVPTS